MTFSSAAVCESSVSETRRELGGNSAPAAPTWVSPDTARDFPGIFNQPVELPHPTRRKDDQ